MKTSRFPARLVTSLFILSLMLFTNCKDEVIRTRTFHTMVPVYISVAKLRAESDFLQAPQPLSSPGKIYLFGNFLFITEVNKGIHIVDNTNPGNPRFIKFISIAGNVDLAVNSNILYADNYVDLLAFDVTDPSNIRQVKRVENVFDNQYIDQARGLILGYKDTVITEVVRGDVYPAGYYEYDAGTPVSNSTGKQVYGTGGSTARFTLMNNNLYTVSQHQLKLFNVSQADNPRYSSTVDLGGGIETIFPYDNKLFIGSTTGMHIYDATVPSAPVKLSTYRHVTSCDPVVVQDKYAYVTLRSDNFCQQGINVLQVLNIENPSNPVLVSSFPMEKPYGLTISGSSLFICEGQYGLKVFNSDDVQAIGRKQLSSVTNIDAADVIAGPKSLIVTGNRGIYQYNYTDPSKLKLISHLALSNTL
ncbi:hypothetical protein GZH53_03470 [Flavihumibacter sp. R14]|nr:hypothetical protein [Flavihumibacter soli]